MNHSLKKEKNFSRKENTRDEELSEENQRKEFCFPQRKHRIHSLSTNRKTTNHIGPEQRIRQQPRG
jgi:hypothetical protein